jgi:hypothetical protein
LLSAKRHCAERFGSGSRHRVELSVQTAIPVVACSNHVCWCIHLFYIYIETGVVAYSNHVCWCVHLFLYLHRNRDTIVKVDIRIELEWFRIDIVILFDNISVTGDKHTIMLLFWFL